MEEQRSLRYDNVIDFLFDPQPRDKLEFEGQVCTRVYGRWLDAQCIELPAATALLLERLYQARDATTILAPPPAELAPPSGATVAEAATRNEVSTCRLDEAPIDIKDNLPLLWALNDINPHRACYFDKRNCKLSFTTKRRQSQSLPDHHCSLDLRDTPLFFSAEIKQQIALYLQNFVRLVKHIACFMPGRRTREVTQTFLRLSLSERPFRKLHTYARHGCHFLNRNWRHLAAGASSGKQTVKLLGAIWNKNGKMVKSKQRTGEVDPEVLRCFQQDVARSKDGSRGKKVWRGELVWPNL